MSSKFKGNNSLHQHVVFSLVKFSSKWIVLVLVAISVALSTSTTWARVTGWKGVSTSPRYAALRKPGSVLPSSIRRAGRKEDEKNACKDEAGGGGKLNDGCAESDNDSQEASSSEVASSVLGANHDDYKVLIKRTNSDAIHTSEAGPFKTGDLHTSVVAVEKEAGPSSSSKERKYTAKDPELKLQIQRIAALLPKGRKLSRNSISLREADKGKREFSVHADKTASPVVIPITSSINPITSDGSHDVGEKSKYMKAKEAAEAEGPDALAAFKLAHSSKTAARIATMTEEEKSGRNHYNYIMRIHNQAQRDKEDPERVKVRKARAKMLRKIAASKRYAKKCRERQALLEKSLAVEAIKDLSRPSDVDVPRSKKLRLDLNKLPIESEGEDDNIARDVATNQKADGMEGIPSKSTSDATHNEYHASSSSTRPSKAPLHARMPELSAHLHQIAKALPKDRNLARNTLTLQDQGDQGLAFQLQLDEEARPIVVQLPPRRPVQRSHHPGWKSSYLKEKERAQAQGEAGIAAFKAKYKAKQADFYDKLPPEVKKSRNQYNYLMRLVNRAELERVDPEAAERKAKSRAINKKTLDKAREEIKDQTEGKLDLSGGLAVASDSHQQSPSNQATDSMNQIPAGSNEEQESMNLVKRAGMTEGSEIDAGSSQSKTYKRRKARYKAASLQAIISKLPKGQKLPYGSVKITDVNEQGHAVTVKGTSMTETQIERPQETEERRMRHEQYIAKLQAKGPAALTTYREKQKVATSKVISQMSKDKIQERNRMGYIARLIKIAEKKKMDPEGAEQDRIHTNLINNQAKIRWRAKQKNLQEMEMNKDEIQEKNRSQYIAKRIKAAEKKKIESEGTEQDRIRTNLINKKAKARWRAKQKLSQEMKAQEMSSIEPSLESGRSNQAENPHLLDLNELPIDWDTYEKEGSDGSHLVKRGNEPVEGSSHSSVHQGKRAVPYTAVILQPFVNKLPKIGRLPRGSLAITDIEEGGHAIKMTDDKNNSVVEMQIKRPTEDKDRGKKHSAFLAKIKAKGPAALEDFRKRRNASALKTRSRMSKEQLHERYQRDYIVRLIKKAEKEKLDPQGAEQDKIKRRLRYRIACEKARAEQEMLSEAQVSESIFINKEGVESSRSAQLQSTLTKAKEQKHKIDLNELPVPEEVDGDVHLIKRGKEVGEGSYAIPAPAKKTSRWKSEIILPIVKKSYGQGRLKRSSVKIQDAGESALQVSIHAEGIVNEPEVVHIVKTERREGKVENDYQQRLARLDAKGPDEVAKYRAVKRAGRDRYWDSLTPQRKKDIYRARHVSHLLRQAEKERDDPEAAEEDKLKVGLRKKKYNAAWRKRQKEIKKEKLKKQKKEVDKPAAKKPTFDLNLLSAEMEDAVHRNEDVVLFKRGDVNEMPSLSTYSKQSPFTSDTQTLTERRRKVHSAARPLLLMDEIPFSQEEPYRSLIIERQGKEEPSVQTRLDQQDEALEEHRKRLGKYQKGEAEAEAEAEAMGEEAFTTWLAQSRASSAASLNKKSLDRFKERSKRNSLDRLLKKANKERSNAMKTKMFERVKDKQLVEMEEDAGDETRMMKRAGETSTSASGSSSGIKHSSDIQLKEKALLHEVHERLTENKRLGHKGVFIGDLEGEGHRGLPAQVDEADHSEVLPLAPTITKRKRIRKSQGPSDYMKKKEKAEAEGPEALTAFKSFYNAKSAAHLKRMTQEQRLALHRMHHVSKMRRRAKKVETDPEGAAKDKLKRQEVNRQSSARYRAKLKRKRESTSDDHQGEAGSSGEALEQVGMDEQSSAKKVNLDFDLNEKSVEEQDLHLVKRGEVVDNQREDFITQKRLSKGNQEVRLLKRGLVEHEKEGSSSKPSSSSEKLDTIVTKHYKPRYTAAQLSPIAEKLPKYERSRKRSKYALTIEEAGEEGHTVQIGAGAGADAETEVVMQVQRPSKGKRVDAYRKRIEREKARGPNGLADFKRQQKAMRERWFNNLTKDQKDRMYQRQYIAKKLRAADMEITSPEAAEEAKRRIRESGAKRKRVPRAKQKEEKQKEIAVQHDLTRDQVASSSRATLHSQEEEEPAAKGIKTNFDLNLPADDESGIEQHLVKRGGPEGAEEVSGSGSNSKRRRGIGQSRYRADQLRQITKQFTLDRIKMGSLNVQTVGGNGLAVQVKSNDRIASTVKVDPPKMVVKGSSRYQRKRAEAEAQGPEALAAYLQKFNDAVKKSNQKRTIEQARERGRLNYVAKLLRIAEKKRIDPEGAKQDEERQKWVRREAARKLKMKRMEQQQQRETDRKEQAGTSNTKKSSINLNEEPVVREEMDSNGLHWHRKRGLNHQQEEQLLVGQPSSLSNLSGSGKSVMETSQVEVKPRYKAAQIKALTSRLPRGVKTVRGSLILDQVGQDGATFKVKVGENDDQHEVVHIEKSKERGKRVDLYSKQKKKATEKGAAALEEFLNRQRRNTRSHRDRLTLEQRRDKGKHDYIVRQIKFAELQIKDPEAAREVKDRRRRDDRERSRRKKEGASVVVVVEKHAADAGTSIQFDQVDQSRVKRRKFDLNRPPSESETEDEQQQQQTQTQRLEEIHFVKRGHHPIESVPSSSRSNARKHAEQDSQRMNGVTITEATPVLSRYTSAQLLPLVSKLPKKGDKAKYMRGIDKMGEQGFSVQVQVDKGKSAEVIQIEKPEVVKKGDTYQKWKAIAEAKGPDALAAFLKKRTASVTAWKRKRTAERIREQSQRDYIVRLLKEAGKGKAKVNIDLNEDAKSDDGKEEGEVPNVNSMGEPTLTSIERAKRTRKKDLDLWEMANQLPTNKRVAKGAATLNTLSSQFGLNVDEIATNKHHSTSAVQERKPRDHRSRYTKALQKAKALGPEAHKIFKENNRSHTQRWYANMTPEDRKTSRRKKALSHEARLAYLERIDPEAAKMKREQLREANNAAGRKHYWRKKAVSPIVGKGKEVVGASALPLQEETTSRSRFNLNEKPVRGVENNFDLNKVPSDSDQESDIHLIKRTVERHKEKEKESIPSSSSNTASKATFNFPRLEYKNSRIHQVAGVLPVDRRASKGDLRLSSLAERGSRVQAAIEQERLRIETHMNAGTPHRPLVKSSYQKKLEIAIANGPEAELAFRNKRRRYSTKSWQKLSKERKLLTSRKTALAHEIKMEALSKVDAEAARKEIQRLKDKRQATVMRWKAKKLLAKGVAQEPASQNQGESSHKATTSMLKDSSYKQVERKRNWDLNMPPLSDPESSEMEPEIHMIKRTSSKPGEASSSSSTTSSLLRQIGQRQRFKHEQMEKLVKTLPFDQRAKWGTLNIAHFKGQDDETMAEVKKEQDKMIEHYTAEMVNKSQYKKSYYTKGLEKAKLLGEEAVKAYKARNQSYVQKSRLKYGKEEKKVSNRKYILARDMKLNALAIVKPEAAEKERQRLKDIRAAGRLRFKEKKKLAAMKEFAASKEKEMNELSKGMNQGMLPLILDKGKGIAVQEIESDSD